MKVYICCSKHFYSRIPPIKELLEKNGHEVTLPASYENPFMEDLFKEKGQEMHATWKADKIRLLRRQVTNNEVVLILNYDKEGEPNYIGGATFLEAYEAFRQKKKLILMNPIPPGGLEDELSSFSPTILNGDLSALIRELQ